MKQQEAKPRIKMLGNQWEFLNGNVYEVDMDTANNLTGMGMAVLTDEPVTPPPPPPPESVAAE